MFEAFKNHSQPDVIHTDFKKTFDSNNLEILIKVLYASNFGEFLVLWLYSYILNRYFVVKVIGVNFNVFLFSLGVLQGGHLSLGNGL